ncbi:MAG: UDP-N-acetylglucosamine 1-carboxyvinyltransferase [Firmicutes bacterium]|nr:UDP-N-acetylglucosamine 1-carboxyvinyltransferase [Bacillota bacterium]
MGYFKVWGGGLPVSGEVCISGAKNAALPIIAAAVLCKRVCLENCPRLSDTATAAEILDTAGFCFDRCGGGVNIEKTDIGCACIPQEMCGKMRSSVLFIAPLLRRFGCVTLFMPGGCRLGARPVDMHLDLLREMGAKISICGDSITARADNLHGIKTRLPFPSVGATETAIMAAVCAEGESEIHNAAKEPEIDDLCAFLNKAGADIRRGEILVIRGRNSLLGDVRHRIMPDRIEAGTYMAAAAITGGELFLKNAVYEHISAFAEVLMQMGCAVRENGDSIYIEAPERLYNPEYIATAPYPLFPTDMQPQLTALAAVKCGDCLIKENIFETRCGHVPQLNKMGAKIELLSRREFLVHGTESRLSPAVTEAADLRCGAALILAALAADGCSVIKNGGYILRGYEDICKKMSLIGVKIKYCT